MVLEDEPLNYGSSNFSYFVIIVKSVSNQVLSDTHTEAGVAVVMGTNWTNVSLTGLR